MLIEDVVAVIEKVREEESQGGNKMPEELSPEDILELKIDKVEGKIAYLQMRLDQEKYKLDKLWKERKLGGLNGSG